MILSKTASETIDVSVGAGCAIFFSIALAPAVSKTNSSSTIGHMLGVGVNFVRLVLFTVVFFFFHFFCGRMSLR